MPQTHIAHFSHRHKPKLALFRERSTPPAQSVAGFDASMTRDQLRAAARERGLSVGGSKDDLLKRLRS